jgi:hypothetical protein
VCSANSSVATDLYLQHDRNVAGDKYVATLWKEAYDSESFFAAVTLLHNNLSLMTKCNSFRSCMMESHLEKTVEYKSIIH